MLTERQREVVFLSVTGMRLQAIAARLGISINTLKRHVDAILKRTGKPTLADIREEFRDYVWEGGEYKRPESPPGVCVCTGADHDVGCPLG